MAKRIYKAEFERRLDYLQYCIDRYRETGRPGNLFPALSSVFRYLWSDARALKK